MKLLWKVNKTELESNFRLTKHTGFAIKSKTFKNEKLFHEYEKMLNEQRVLGINEECEFNVKEINIYYMLHWPVISADKSTTKVRIVIWCFISLQIEAS